MKLRLLPEQSCDCPWGAAVGWVAERFEVEPGAAAAGAAAAGRVGGYGWIGRPKAEGKHQD